MTLARKRDAEQCYLITVVVVEGRNLLLPLRKVNDIFETALGRALKKTEVEFHCGVVNVNHYHLVVSDATKPELGEFLRELNKVAAVELNRCHGKDGPVFRAHYHDEPLEDPDEILNAMAYTLTNPVKDGLVRAMKDWPGYITGIGEIGGRARQVRRGEAHDYSPRTTLDASYTIPAVVPRVFREAGVTAAAFRARLGKACKRWEQYWRGEYRKTGYTGYMTTGELRDLPTNQPQPRPKPKTDLDIIRKTRRLTDLKQRRRLELRLFHEEYELRLKEWREGDRTVRFPLGTYKMRRLHAVNIAPGVDTGPSPLGTTPRSPP